MRVAARITAALRGRAALVVGRAGMDLYPLPDGTSIEEAENYAVDLGGSAAGISVALAKLGGRAALLTALSDDNVGGFVLSRLRRYGVDTTYCNVVAGLRRTSLALAETKPAPAVVIYRNEAADLAITEADADRVDLSVVGVVIVTGTALSRQPSRVAVGRLLKRAKATERPLVLDIDYRAEAWDGEGEARETLAAAARTVDLVVGNAEEFDILAGNSHSDNHNNGRAFAEGLARAGIDALYKMGRGGCDMVSAGGVRHIGVFAVEAAKPFGAGDAFLGAFVAGLAQGDAAEQAVRYGAAAAALTVSRRGMATAMPDKAELESFMRRR